MGEKTLFIEIFQPYSQYRNPFTFYHAQTYPLPPKSTIVGMLQNATDRYYAQEFWSVKISIHGGFESTFWNYQLLIKGDVKIDEKLRIMNYQGRQQGRPLYNEGIKAQRTPVNQQELFNGHLYLFLRDKEEIINEVKTALDKPKKILYLGRSEDVAYIRQLELVEGTTNEAKKSLWLEYPTYIKKQVKNSDNEREFPIKKQKYPVYSIPVRVIFSNDGIPVKNKAEITKNTRRDVTFETVIYTGFDYIVKLSESITYEEFQVKGKKFRIVSEFGWL